MAFGVFIHRPDSIYDDVPSEQYQFPKRYLKPAKQCEGGWIVYLEPSKVKNTRGYFAVAKVQEIIPDPNSQNEGMYLAIIEPGTYLDFGDPVSFSDEGYVIERGLLNDEGKISGRAQAAVRTLSSEDFTNIVERGLGRDKDILPREDHRTETGVSDAPQTSLQVARDRVRLLTSRAARDHNFRKTVLRAYKKRCAITGLRFINGGGNAEVEAAHILPVTENGPDIIGNGIALSRTMHWMFDRGLIGLEDDLTIMVSSLSNDAEAVRSMINNTGALLTPQRPSDHPRTEYVTWHRENCFKD